MACQGLESLPNQTVQSFMKFPLTCDYYFYFKIMAGLFVFIALTLFFEERNRVGRSNIMACFGISAIAIIFLALIGTLIGIITADIMILILVLGCVFIALWLLT